MSPNKHTITDSEYTIMKILWASKEKCTVAHVVNALDDHRWSASTVSTFLQRLLKKEVVGCEKRGKANLYYPLLAQADYHLQETETFLDKVYQGSVKNMVAALYENQKLSQEDISDLKSLFELE